MIRCPSQPLTLSLCICGILGAGLRGQEASDVDMKNATKNKFLDGWMAELLHADRDKAVKTYKEAMQASNLSNFQSELATLRLWEFSWKIADRRKYVRALGEKGVYPAGGVTTGFIRRLEVDAFADALKANDSKKLDQLRAKLVDLTKQYSQVRDPRPIVRRQLNDFRGETLQVDSELEALKKEYKSAKKVNDVKRMRDAWIAIQKRGRAKRQTASRRVIAKRWAEMTRLHLASQHERASGMEDRLPRFRQRLTARTVMRRIQSWNSDHRITRTRSVLNKLDTYLRLRELLPEERTVLRALRQRIDELSEAGQHQQALVLAARTPYRDRLFSR